VSDFSVDLISDLNLNKHDQFDWSGKPTSLYCAVAGNISSDLDHVEEVLQHLSEVYRGVFFIDGSLENTNIQDYKNTVQRLTKISESIKNVIYLHTKVVLFNDVAFVGINGWYNSCFNITSARDHLSIDDHRNEDLGYLSNTIKSMQLYGDAKKVVVISSSVPSMHLLYTNDHSYFQDGAEPGLALVMDTNHKVSNWLYGSTEIMADNVFNNRRYVNNPCISGQPYWPKRIII
jgi:predicted phosphohydrolase